MGKNISAQHPSLATLEDLDRYLTAQLDRFSGVVLVAHEGQSIFHKSYGFASERFGIRNRLDNKFNLASINKMFTVVAVLQLAERELLALDDPLSRFRPDFRPEIGDKVKIRHLLQQRSGWGDYWDNETYLANWTTLRSVEDYVAFIKAIPLDFEPGQDRQHSDIGFEVLGAVIEAVSGQSYYDYVCAHILEPLGMVDTDSYERDTPIENLAIGYTHWAPSAEKSQDWSLAYAFAMCDRGVPPYGEKGQGPRKENTFLLPVKGTPAGGGYSTAPDLLKFGLALRHCQLLSLRYTAINFSGFNDVETPPVDMSKKLRFVFAGAAPGANTFYGVKSPYDIIVLSNYDPPVAEDLGSRIVGMLEQA